MPLALSDEATTPTPLAPLVGRPDQVAETLAAFRDAGLHHVILSPFYGVSPEQQPEDLAAVERLLERFMSEVVPALGESVK